MSYLIFLEFFSISMIGLLYHYYEKRFMHLTTECSLKDYLLKERASTYKALSGIFVTATGLSLAHGESFGLSLAELSALLALGYGFDNALNKVPSES